MKKIFIFLALFTSSQSFAQAPNIATKANNNQINNARNAGNTTQGSNVKNIAPPSAPQPSRILTEQEKALIEKNTAEHKEFQASLKKLTPSEQKRFQDINKNFALKMIELNKVLNEETSKISNIQNLIAIQSYISSGTLYLGERALPNDQKSFYQKQITIYNQLSPDKKKLIKKAIIKFRKNIHSLEKQRREEFKKIFKKDFNNFKESETDAQIEKDNKL